VGEGGASELIASEAPTGTAPDTSVTPPLVEAATAPAVAEPEPPAEIQFEALPELLAPGLDNYTHYCSVYCGGNGVSGDVFPDIRYSPEAMIEALESIVLRGTLRGTRAARGLPAFVQVLSADDVEAIRVCLLSPRAERSEP